MADSSQDNAYSQHDNKSQQDAGTDAAGQKIPHQQYASITPTPPALVSMVPPTANRGPSSQAVPTKVTYIRDISSPPVPPNQVLKTQQIPLRNLLPAIGAPTALPHRMSVVPPVRQFSFQNIAEARQVMATPILRPFSKDYGVPTNDQDRLPYVLKVYDAFIDVSDVHDQYFHGDAEKFDSQTGIWRDRRAVEGMSHIIVDCAVTLHTKGIRGLLFKCNLELRKMKPYDRTFTFPERIYFMCYLIRHHKSSAHMVMTSESMIEEYLAKIWTTLDEMVTFRSWWGSLNENERFLHLRWLPYEGVPAEHITEEQANEIDFAMDSEKIQRRQAQLQHLRNNQAAGIMHGLAQQNALAQLPAYTQQHAHPQQHGSATQNALQQQSAFQQQNVQPRGAGGKRRVEEVDEVERRQRRRN